MSDLPLERFIEAVIASLRCATGIEAVIATLRGITDASVRGIAETVRMDASSRGIAVSIDVRVGDVTWVFPEEIALGLVRKMLAVSDPAPELAIDRATELANILTGRAIPVLEQHGFRCQLGPPRVHVGELPRGASVRMTTAAGPIDLVLRLSA